MTQEDEEFQRLERDDDELHEKASAYASNRKDAYLEKMKLGKVKKKSQDELNWVWVAHYEGYKEGHMSKDGITLNNIRHPRGKPALGDLNPESLETVEIDLPEPIGYVSEGSVERLATNKQAHEQIRNFRLFTHDVPLYTNPPQRTWVGLTDKEVLEFTRASWGVGVTASEFIRDIEAKLKEKNT